MSWLKQLNDFLIDGLAARLKDPTQWKSLIINRRKPITYRAFTMIGENRLCLHKFEQFDTSSEEGFFHPHPWPGAFRIVDGAYRMEVGITPDRFVEKPSKVIYTTELTNGSSYEIDDPLLWHRVMPLTDEVYTVMLNGVPWTPDVAHTQVRTTKGKDLESMSADQLARHLDFFYRKLYR